MEDKPQIEEKIHISVVSPVYGEELRLEELFARLRNTLINITGNFEIILVNDQSPNDAWEVIQKLAEKDSRVRGINLTRNFGQHYAVTAGLDYARGDWCVVMDCDLQDQPEEIASLYKKAQEGFDMVVARRAVRRDSLIKKITSRLYYLVFNYLTDQKVDSAISNFGIYSQRAVSAIRQFKERGRTFGMLAFLAGFKRAYVDVTHSQRASGKSSYTYRARLHLALDQILLHSNKPLRLAVKLGFAFSAISFSYAVWRVVIYFVWGEVASGWTSLIVSLFFLSGITISIIGLVGLYVGKIYEEVKARPLYIVMEKTFD